MNDINRELLELVVPVIEQESNMVVGQSIVFSFPVENSDSIRPFIVFSKTIITKEKHYFLSFKMESGERYNVFVDYELCAKQKLGDTNFVAFPLAGILNDLSKQNKKLIFKTISKSNLLNSNTKNMPTSIEKLTVIKSIVLNKTYQSIILKRYNVIPFISDNELTDKFYIEYCGIDSIGAPVLLFNEGTYYSQNNVFVGNRLFFLGLISKHESIINEVCSFNMLSDLITKKYAFNY